jgi:hypothetical protein
VSSVESALRAAGLSPGQASANGLLIPVNASAGALAQAFDVSFDRIQLASGRLAYANTAAPSLPQSVSAYVQGVGGLDSLTVPQSQAAVPAGAAKQSDAALTPQVVTGGPQPCAAASSVPETTTGDHPTTNDAYTADEIASSYGLSTFYAVLELEPNLTSDITAYESCYGTNTTVQYVPIDNTTDPDNTTSATAGSGEAALDIEQLIGLAPRATIDVYQGPDAASATDADYLAVISAMVTNSSVNVISTSWGVCEAGNDDASTVEENYLFQEAATQGQTVFAAAGDDGAQDCSRATTLSSTTRNSLAVDDPGSQPYVTSVGGTSMTNFNSPNTQTVWNNNQGAGGGGISAIWPMPTWQANAAGALGVVNGSSSGTPCAAITGYCREVPDVSADADPDTGYAIYWSNPTAGTRCPTYPWCAIGGTSAAAPLWAAYTALVNASSGCNGAPIGYSNPLLYEVAGSAYASYFTDIRSGNNELTNYTTGGYNAAIQYDMASGLGTPIGGALGTALCRASDKVTVTNPGNQSAQVGGTITPLTIAAQDRQGHLPLSFSATGLPAGLAISPSTGQISGTTTAVGTSTVTVNVSDIYSGAVAQPTTFTWTVESTTATNTQTVTTPAQTVTQAVPGPTTTVTTPAATVTQPAQTITTQGLTITLPATTTTVPGTTRTLTSVSTVTTPGPTTTVAGATKTVTVAAPTPVTKTQTLSVTYGDQAIKLTTPIPTQCAAPYKVNFSTTTISGSPKLRFTSVAYYLDKGIAESKRRAKLVHGRRHIKRVTAYKANATSRKASGSTTLKLTGLRAGTHTLKAIASFTASSGGKTSTYSKTLTTKLKAC